MVLEKMRGVPPVGRVCKCRMSRMVDMGRRCRMLRTDRGHNLWDKDATASYRYHNTLKKASPPHSHCIVTVSSARSSSLSLGTLSLSHSALSLSHSAHSLSLTRHSLSLCVPVLDRLRVGAVTRRSDQSRRGALGRFSCSLQWRGLESSSPPRREHNSPGWVAVLLRSPGAPWCASPERQTR